MAHRQIRQGDGPRARQRSGQAMVEMAFVFPLFLVVLFAAVDTALWCIETNAAVAAAEAGVRVAVASYQDPYTLNHRTNQPQTPTASQVQKVIQPLLQGAMFGVHSYPPQPPTGCPSSIPAGTIYVCVSSNPHGPIVGIKPPDSGVRMTMVTCQVEGTVPTLIPPIFQLASFSEFHMNVGATSAAFTFAP